MSEIIALFMVFYHIYPQGGCIKFLSPFFRITECAEYAEKTAATDRLAYFWGYSLQYKFMKVSFPRLPCTPRIPRFRTQRKYKIP